MNDQGALMSKYPYWDTIGLDQIHDSGQWNLHPFLAQTDQDHLLDSLLQSGMLHPPVVQVCSNGYELLSGRRRLYTLKQALGQTRCCCQILSPDTPVLTLLHLILTDQESAGPLSPMEQAWFLACCGRHMEPSAIIERFLPRLGRRAHRTQLDTQLHLLELPPLLQHHIHEGVIDETIGLELLHLGPDEQIFFAGLFTALGMGRGKQKRLLALSRDLAGRNGCRIGELFADEESREILAGQAMNPPQTTNRLLELLQRRCLPRSTEAELAFKKRLTSLDLPSDWQIAHCPAFEKDSVSLTIPFPDLDHCAQQLPALIQLLKRET